MNRRLSFQPFSWFFVAAAAGFAVIAGFQLGGGTLPVVPRLSTEILYVVAAGLFGVGVFASVLRRPDLVGRITPTIYVTVALLPLLRFAIPGIGLIRFLPLALIAPVVYGLYRDAEPIPSHTRIARIAMFAALATAVSSVVANSGTTDYPRLLLMLGGIVLLVGAAPRAWSGLWEHSVTKATWLAFWAIAISSIALLASADSFIDDRYRGAFTSPNTLGALIAVTAPIAASRARFAILPWAAALGIVIMSGSRGGLLALGVAAAIVLARRRQFVQLAAMVLISLAAFGAGAVRTEADHEIAFGVNTRQLIWDEVIESSKDSILTGYGFGSFDSYEFSNETQRFAGANPQSHNSWLDAWYEQGFLGLIPWVAALLVGVWTAFRAGPFWAGAITAGLLSATFESWLFAIGGGIGSLFWLLFGAAALTANRANAADEVSRGPVFDALPRWT